MGKLLKHHRLPVHKVAKAAVRDYERPARLEQNVVRLEVTMDKAQLVRVLECVGEDGAVLGHLVGEVQRQLRDDLGAQAVEPKNFCRQAITMSR